MTGITSPLPLESLPYEFLPRAYIVSGTWGTTPFSRRVAMVQRPKCAWSQSGVAYAGAIIPSPVLYPEAQLAYSQIDYAPGGFGIASVYLYGLGSVNWPQNGASFPATISEFDVGYNPGAMPPEGTTINITPATCLPSDEVHYCRVCVRCQSCTLGPSAYVAVFEYEWAPGEIETIGVEGERTTTSP